MFNRTKKPGIFGAVSATGTATTEIVTAIGTEAPKIVSQAIQTTGKLLSSVDLTVDIVNTNLESMKAEAEAEAIQDKVASAVLTAQYQANGIAELVKLGFTDEQARKVVGLTSDESKKA